MSKQTVLRFSISIRETFSNSIAFTVINKYGKGAVVQISTVFRSVYRVACQRASKTGLFRHLSNHVFGRPQVRNYISHDGQLVFENIKNLI